MRVLDLDLDFFLSDVCPLAPIGERPADGAATPWTRDAVREYLEKHLGLSTASPVRGAVFETHDQALDVWQRWMRAGELTAPFEVVHIDAHADLAIAPPGPDFVLEVVLATRPQMRAALDRYRNNRKLDEGNYLLFALAFRWIAALTVVRAACSKDDIPQRILDDVGEIHLRSGVSRLLEPVNGIEPRIPFSRIDDPKCFFGSGFDFVTLARSPRYAPRATDPLIAVVEEYITPFDAGFPAEYNR